LGGRDQEDLWFKGSPGKKFMRYYERSGMCLPFPAMQGSTNRRMVVQAMQGIKQDAFLKITRDKKGWEHGTSSRASA
jgi:hypothetical protein